MHKGQTQFRNDAKSGVLEGQEEDSRRGLEEPSGKCDDNESGVQAANDDQQSK